MRAAEATAVELKHLEGEELRRQQERVQLLVATANKQHAEGVPSQVGNSRDIVVRKGADQTAHGGSKHQQASSLGGVGQNSRLGGESGNRGRHNREGAASSVSRACGASQGKKARALEEEADANKDAP